MYLQTTYMYRLGYTYVPKLYPIYFLVGNVTCNQLGLLAFSNVTFEQLWNCLVSKKMFHYLQTINLLGYVISTTKTYLYAY